MAEPQDQAIRDLTRMSPALGRPAMPKTEAFLSAQRPEIPGYISEQQISPVMQELRGAEEAARTRAGEAEVDIEAAKRAEKGREAQMKGELVQRQARETAALPERQQLMAKRQEFANAAFAPTRDNAEDLAKLFSLIGVLGVAIGGRGRGAGLQAMTAMNGMLEGYRRGRGDLYKQQLGEFDRSLKAMQQQIATLEKQYAEAVKLKALDREAGELEIQRVLAESDSPVLKAMRSRQGDLAALSYIQNMAKDVTTAATLRNSLQTAADQRQARQDEQRAREAFQTQERLARQQFEAGQRAIEAGRKNLQVVQTPQGPRVMDISQLPRATQEELTGAIPFTAAGKLSGGLKPDAKERNAYIADNVLLADINDMRKDLQRPSLQKLIKDYRVEAFLTEEGKVLNQLISSEIPNELQVFLTKVRDVRNNYYLDKSGKAVTGGEALRNYGTVPQPGDSAEAILNKFDSLSSRVNRTIDIRRQMYGLPQISVKAGDATGVRQGDEIPLRFNTEADVEAANLEPGTLVIVGNRRGRVQAKQAQ